MLKFFVLLLGFFLCVGCKTTAKVEPQIQIIRILDKEEVQGTTLSDEDLSSVRYGDKIKGYTVGRYVDPNGKIMHEGHTIYRLENPSAWNRSPNAPTAVPLGATVAVSHPERTTDLKMVKMEASVERQNQLLKDLLAQYESVLKELKKKDQNASNN